MKDVKKGPHYDSMTNLARNSAEQAGAERASYPLGVASIQRAAISPCFPGPRLSARYCTMMKSCHSLFPTGQRC